MKARTLLVAIGLMVQRMARSGRWAVLAAGFLMAALPQVVIGHGGELELSVSPDTIAAGEEVAVSGEGFVAGSRLELHLTGPNGDAHFGDVTADDEGAFREALRIPGDITPGIYLVRAEGVDREASAELTVGAMAGMPQAAPEALPERERANAWRAVALVLFLGLGIAGVALTRPGRPEVSTGPST